MNWAQLLVGVFASMMLVSFGMFCAVRRAQRRLESEAKRHNASCCCFEDADQKLVVLRRLEEGRFHLFLSHSQQHGQDQVKVISSELQKCVRDIHCFLDVDTLEEIADLEEHVHNSVCVLLFLTMGIFDRVFVLKELRAAKNFGKKASGLRV
jgi:hypothetical protein